MTSSMNLDPNSYNGLRLGNYRVSSFIGDGDFGLVFKGVDMRDGKDVAIKILRPDALRHARDEFDNEDNLLYQLTRAKRSNVIQRLDSGEQEDNDGRRPSLIQYIVLELASECLQDLVVNREAYSLLKRFKLYRGVVVGVHQVHSSKIRHRDLKSANCLIVRQTAKVADFGRARGQLPAEQYPDLNFLAGHGDIRFAPPELLWLGFDKPGAWRLADVYGLGSLLVEVVTGQGMTALALGSGLDFKRQIDGIPPAEAEKYFHSRVADLRGKYDSALELVSGQLPAGIAGLTTNLIRQVCDPDPGRRLPQSSKNPAHDKTGLEWMINRVDIIIKILENPQAQNGRYGRRRGPRP